MVDLQGKDKGNISLPARLQSPDIANMDSEDEENYPMIINMQKTMYEALIRDLQQRIERLQNRNEYLENFCESVKSDSEYKNIETENEIVELNNNIAVQTKKVDDLKKKCDEFEKLRDQQQLNHLEKVKQTEEKFEKTRIKLSSELKTINSKINTIEDFKLTEERLREKYEAQNEFILKKEEEMQQILNEIEYKSKIHKINLKKECYKEILKVSENFQLELKSSMPQTVQRIMRESIVLENELVRLWNDHSNMADSVLNNEDLTDEFKEKIKEAKMNTRRRLINLKIQNLLLKKLRSVHQAVKKELSTVVKPRKDFEKEYLKVIEDTRSSEFLNAAFRKRKLEVVLHREKVKLQMTNKYKLLTSRVLKKCCDVLNYLKSVVDSALSINNLNVDESFKNMDLETFASYLLNIIEDYDCKKWLSNTESVETVEGTGKVYAAGDLGFEPKHIEIEEAKKEIDSVYSMSMKSTFVILKELEKLADESVDVKHESLQSQRSSYGSIGTDISTSSKSTRKESRIDIKELIEETEDVKSKDAFEFEESEYEYEMLEQLDYLNYEQEQFIL